MDIRSALIVVKQHHAPAMDVAVRMARWLKDRGVASRRCESHTGREELRAASQDMDVLLVLAGDGAILGVARELIGLQKPILGVNFGRVGFLTEVPAHDWEPALNDLLYGAYQVQGHTALCWRIIRNGHEVNNGWAVNDVVAARGEVARAVSLDLHINGAFLSRLRCDGVIISAPLGATAYAASAHGPLAFPSLRAQIVTPISPFAGAFPPLVLPEDCPVRLDVHDFSGDVHLTVDGQVCLPLLPGDQMEVHGVPDQVSLLVRDPDWYLRRLVERGFVMPGPGTYSQHPSDD